MISIIIPAHNEESVIERCLQPLLPGINNGELEVIVVCNGSTDATAQRVKGANSDIKLIEKAVASKSNALNLGDQAASYFPRFYLDADVVISLESIRKVASILKSGKYLVAAPQRRIHYENASWSVQCYWSVWEQLPYIKNEMIGTGVYALSRNGRERFEKFPNITNDDGYIRLLFTEDERKYLIDADCCVHITAPLTMRDLLTRRVRNHLGDYMLRKKFPHLKENKKKVYRFTAFELLKDIKKWPRLSIYFYVVFSSKITAQRYFRTNKHIEWVRDDSSRT